MGQVVWMGALGVQCLHSPICEFHLPKVMGLVEVHSTVLPVGEPTSQKVRSTRMTSHYKGFPWIEAICPFFQTPCLIVLPREGGAAKKVEKVGGTKFPASLRPCRKVTLNVEETQRKGQKGHYVDSTNRLGSLKPSQW